jgi:hypothetical protein
VFIVLFCFVYSSTLEMELHFTFNYHFCLNTIRIVINNWEFLGMKSVYTGKMILKLWKSLRLTFLFPHYCKMMIGWARGKLWNFETKENHKVLKNYLNEFFRFQILFLFDWICKVPIFPLNFHLMSFPKILIWFMRGRTLNCIKRRGTDDKHSICLKL